MEYNCDECSRNFLLPPPKFVSPPPPIPNSFKNLVECNDEKVLFQINNWEHDMCESTPIFEESILTGRMERTLTFVGMFACILLLVIGFYIIYVKRLINQRNDGCKDKILVKHTLLNSDTNSSDSHTMFLNKFQYENLYEQCNQYKYHQAQDFINYVPTNDMGNALVAEYQNYHQQLKSPKTIVRGICCYRKPINYSENNYDDYLGLDNEDKYNRSSYCFTDYVQSISLIATSAIVNDRAFKSHTPSLIEYQQDFYSIVSKDFNELPVYSRTDTGYGGSQEDNTEPSSSERNKRQNSKGSSIDSDLEIRRYGPSINSINSNQYKYNNYNNESYPEYIDIELALPKLILN